MKGRWPDHLVRFGKSQPIGIGSRGQAIFIMRGKGGDAGIDREHGQHASVHHWPQMCIFHRGLTALEVIGIGQRIGVVRLDALTGGNQICDCLRLFQPHVMVVVDDARTRLDAGVGDGHHFINGLHRKAPPQR